jgi:GTP pyrophosphokinase
VQLQDIIAELQGYHPDPDVELIRQAHAFAMKHHKGQTRASGEPYISHVQEVAYLVTKLRLDVASVITALLHDTVEDTDVQLETIESQFGADVAQLVDGVTKLSQVKFSSRLEQQSENFRKMLLAMAKDIRVLLVKLCDRAHNMRTLEFLSESRRKRIAQETQDIYAPLAHRLGIYWMKSELEDSSLRYLKPAAYENIKNHINAHRTDRERYIDEVSRVLQNELEENGVKGIVTGRPKHFFSIYQKMEQQNLGFDEIYDITAFRIIVPTLMDCYSGLGVIHAAWRPIPGRFKDYIAMPKPNGYQSLHTTVIGPRGQRVEIQIRTTEMHEIAEQGIAAHWRYKEGASKTEERKAFNLPWLKDLIESEKLLRDPVEFLSVVKEDLFPQEVFVFSPKGDLIALPKGATPIDFAYYIHSEVGHHCTGSRVSGKQVPLAYKLQNGDTVEITTTDGQKPSKDWLNLVVTTKAKQRIRGWLRGEERKRSITVGKELLTKDLRKVKLTLNKVKKDGSLMQVAKDMGFRDIDLLFAEIGYGKLSTRGVVGRLVPDVSDLEAKLDKEESALQKIFQKAAKAFREGAGIKVHGLDDVVFRFAKCCEPLPGDELVGYVTRGRGVAIHTRGCPQTLSFDPRRLLPVSWDSSVKTERPIHLKVHCQDRVGILASLTQSISDNGANISSANVGATPDGKAVCSFQITIESTKQLEQVIRSIENIDGVMKVERATRAE